MIQDTETAEEMASFFEPASGTVFHIDAHKRVTAKMIASRYDQKRGMEATTWGQSDVAVLACGEGTAETVRDDIPRKEIVAEVQAGSEPEEDN